MGVYSVTGHLTESIKAKPFYLVLDLFVLFLRKSIRT